MTLRYIMDTTIIGEAAKDRRLTATDFRIFVHLYYSVPKSIRSHGRGLGFAWETVRRSIRRLISFGWALELSGDTYPLITVWMPLDVEKKIADALMRIRTEVPFMGEWLMKCLLDLIVADRDFRDNVRPEWLVKGDGRRRFELDRWYPNASVAFEFQGQQHFRIGMDFSTTQDDLNKQVDRDNTKFGLCARHGIRLIEVTARDLTFETLRGIVEPLLPVVPIRSEGPLFNTLDGMCRSYRNIMARTQAA